jgi:twitching motility protein PilT
LEEKWESTEKGQTMNQQHEVSTDASVDTFLDEVFGDFTPVVADAPTVEVSAETPEPSQWDGFEMDAQDLPPLHLAAEDRPHIEELLRYVVEVKASDLHIKPGSPPSIRLHGHLIPLDLPKTEPQDSQQLAYGLMVEKERDELEKKGEVDFGYPLADAGRFRVNIHKQRGTIGIAARRILPEPPDFGQLKLPPAVETLANEHRGLLLITGPTSSGKTSTCGAILRHINTSRRCHIVTIEDPIEILHNDKQSVVTQREIGMDTESFSTALRGAMRQDPDVIFIGEIRDTETVEAALQAAETGHLVIATLHTTDVVETINRIVDFYPSHQQRQVRVGLAASLIGIVTQRLLPKVGGGRAPAVEIMVNNGRTRDCILDSERSHEIHDIVAESAYYGMQTFNQALIDLFRRGEVTLEEAKNASGRPHDLTVALQQAGLLEI